METGRMPVLRKTGGVFLCPSFLCFFFFCVFLVKLINSRADYGSSVLPIKKRSHSRAAPRPSLKAQTTRLWPRRQSPQANTPLMLVAYFSYSAFTLVRG